MALPINFPVEHFKVSYLRNQVVRSLESFGVYVKYIPISVVKVMFLLSYVGLSDYEFWRDFSWDAVYASIL